MMSPIGELGGTTVQIENDQIVRQREKVHTKSYDQHQSFWETAGRTLRWSGLRVSKSEQNDTHTKQVLLQVFRGRRRGL
jgi:hypothetical protein